MLARAHRRGTAAITLTCAVTALLLTGCGPDGATKAMPPAASSAPTAQTTGARHTQPPATQSTSPTVISSAGGTTAPAGSDSVARCRTKDLGWTLTRLPGGLTSAREPGNFELVVVNSGSRSCILAGFPKLEFHNGKGPQAIGVGDDSSPAPVTLGAGRKAGIALRFPESSGNQADSGSCAPMVTANGADVAAPGDSTVGRAPVMDQNGKQAEVTICGDKILMSPPSAR